MSIVESLKGRVSPKTPTAADLTRQLATAEAELAELTSRHGDVALDSLANVAGADDKLKTLEGELSAKRAQIATLKAAQATAAEREAAALAAQRAGLQKAQRRAGMQHLATREKAAVALAAALEEAAKQYRLLAQHSEKAQAACPILTKWPDGSLCGFDDVRKLVTGEMWRVSAAPGDSDHRALPGSAYPSLQHQWDPAGIPPLVGRIKTANAQVIARLNEAGKSVES